jgi:hypothetical protein
MKKPILLLAAVTVLLAAAYFGVASFSKPKTVSAGPAPAAEITYVCRETKKLSRGPRQSTPAVNTATGRVTLIQALYCAECRQWRAAPPPELRERFPAGPTCPVHKAALSESGPIDRPLAAVNR